MLSLQALEMIHNRDAQLSTAGGACEQLVFNSGTPTWPDRTRNGLQPLSP